MQTKTHVNKTLLFFLSLIPGVGHMYIGLLKTGLSYIVLFVGAFALGIEMDMGFLLSMMVPLWFYSFFDVWKIYRLSPEEFADYNDELVIKIGNGGGYGSFLDRYGKIVGFIAVLSGTIFLLRRFVWSAVYEFLPENVAENFDRFVYSLPQIVVGALIIALGIWLIKGKSRELKEEKQTPEGE